MPDEHLLIQSEFTRAAKSFAQRTAGRFDDMDVVAFSQAASADLVAEVGAGTGNFLSLFATVTDRLLAIDLTPRMLKQAAVTHEGLLLIAADAARLPLPSRSVDLVSCAQMLHHVHEPLPVLKEMRRVSKGRVLVVDQAAPENFEQAVIMNALELVRDPSHAASRPPSPFRTMLQAAGLRMVDERLWEGPQRLSQWMWPEEFPEERIATVRTFIEQQGAQTGMDFERDGDDWVFTRRRVMLLAERT
jgi:ubiquinone/menaquinone biosynthesis C-methylase UbiE